MTGRHLSERMPAVLRAEDRWSSEDEAHLDRCAECHGEWRLVSGFRPTAIDLDVEQVAKRVVAQLASDARVLPIRNRSRRRWLPLGLVAAASVSLAVTVWGPNSGEAPDQPSSSVVGLFPELGDLMESELELVLASFDEGLRISQDSIVTGEILRLGDLTDDELETLLESVEG